MSAETTDRDLPAPSQAPGDPIPSQPEPSLVDDAEVRRQVELFYYRESELLDDHRYRDWLGLLADEVRYRAPVRTTRRSDGRVDDDRMFWFDDDRQSLELRIRRLETDVAWAEEPPSRTRRIVGNLRVRPGPGDSGTETVAVRSNLLCFRNRGESPDHDLIAAERHDVLRRDGAEWVLLAREIRFDHGTMGTKNLALLF